MKYSENESSTLEFKRVLSKNDQIIKTVVAFCNQKGGRLIIGIDNDGTIVGLAEELITQTIEYLDKSIYEACIPPIIPAVYAQRIGEKVVLVIQVSAGMNKPYYIKSQGLEKGTYIRLGRSTMRANADIIQELQWQKQGRSYDTMPVYHASIDELDSEKFSQFLGRRKDGDKKSPEISVSLQAYNLTAEEHAHRYPSIAGMLLFGKNPQRYLSEAFIICTHFEGIEGREAIATRDCVGTLFEQFESAYAFVIRQLEHSFTIKGPRRKETLEIPPEALREALLNAIVHRNYHINAPIKVAVFQNRIEIFSPGDFPGPLNVANLTMGNSYMRNLAIVTVFRQMGYIEKLGSGFITILSSYQREGLPKPQIIEGENYVKVILPRPKRRMGSVTHVDERVTHVDENDLKSIMDLFETAPEFSKKRAYGFVLLK